MYLVTVLSNSMVNVFGDSIVEQYVNIFGDSIVDQYG